MAWDAFNRANTNDAYKCGKCEGTDFYIAVQVMSQGRTNTFTKNVEVVTCKKCDIPMMRRAAGRNGSDPFKPDPSNGMNGFFRIFGVISGIVLLILGVAAFFAFAQ